MAKVWGIPRKENGSVGDENVEEFVEEAVVLEADHVRHRSEPVVELLGKPAWVVHLGQLARLACVGRQHVRERKLALERKLV